MILQEKSSTKKKSDFCLRCGQCCRNFVMRIIIKEDFAKWLRRVYGAGFSSESVDLTLDGNKVKIIFKNPCQFLDKNNLCIIYEDRPQQCRDHWCEKTEERFKLWKELRQGIL